MKATAHVPTIPVGKFKRTKIIATIGPSTDSYQAIEGLIKSGVNGLRLNFSHGSEQERTKQIGWIRKAAVACGKPVAIIQDLQGPKIRLGDFDGVVPVQPGQSLAFKFRADYERSGWLPTQHDLSLYVKRGQRLLLCDGAIRTVVSSVRDGVIYATSESAGVLIKRKGINLPDTDLGGDILTAKDKRDLAFGSTHDVDYVAVSFVQTEDDILRVRRSLKALGSQAKIIAKIETRSAAVNLEPIIEASDAVMIARGDLATETSPEAVPVLQRQIVGLGLRYATPTIVATQMMASMAEAQEPTRAEVSDVATAVIIGADAVMLSDETASGKFPLETVKMMKRIILYTQDNSPLKVSFPVAESVRNRQSAISEAVISLSNSLPAAAIVAETRSGATALQMASRRPTQPVIAVTSDLRVANQLAIVFGTKSYVRPDRPQAADRLTDWLRRNRVLARGDMIVLVAGRYPGVVGTTDTIKVRMLE